MITRVFNPLCLGSNRHLIDSIFVCSINLEFRAYREGKHWLSTINLI